MQVWRVDTGVSVYIYLLIENVFDLFYLCRAELGKFQVHLSPGHVAGRVFVARRQFRRVVLFVRIGRVPAVLHDDQRKCRLRPTTAWLYGYSTRPLWTMRTEKPRVFMTENFDAVFTRSGARVAYDFGRDCELSILIINYIARAATRVKRDRKRDGARATVLPVEGWLTHESMSTVETIFCRKLIIHSPTWRERLWKKKFLVRAREHTRTHARNWFTAFLRSAAVCVVIIILLCRRYESDAHNIIILCCEYYVNGFANRKNNAVDRQ